MSEPILCTTEVCRSQIILLGVIKETLATQMRLAPAAVVVDCSTVRGYEAGHPWNAQEVRA